ncbi:conserved membrane protein of unknown function [Candidatus Nitrosocosmicus franklandus]|uniref:Uncharacterized protein n=2 Tax=Candidatus Nitrosocosmicus franklandianus TaxID=1798806 RepID=A0A484IEV9_9ARCH|nr:conserved membrane protein of unknown function [Candidatus Nitrosocosmicus franklandus]
MDIWMGTVNALINMVNLGLLGALIYTFARMYQTSKANFTLGLIFFCSLLMINSLISVYSYITMSMLFSDLLVPYLLAISIAEMAGLAIFLKITLE